MGSEKSKSTTVMQWILGIVLVIAVLAGILSFTSDSGGSSKAQKPSTEKLF